MKYNLEISGGFSGRTRHFRGELDPQTQAVFLPLIKAGSKPGNTELRDGYSYELWLGEKGNHRGVYDDSNMPLAVRNFIQSLLDSKP